MKNVIGLILAVYSTVFFGVFAVACFLAPPISLDSRDVLILAFGLAGLLLGILAVRELRSSGQRSARVRA